MKRLIVFCVLWWFEIGFQMNLVASSLAEQKIVPEANQVSIGPKQVLAFLSEGYFWYGKESSIVQLDLPMLG